MQHLVDGVRSPARRHGRAPRVSGKPRPPITQPIATGAKQFEERQITAPIFATGWDDDVRVTMRADGRIGVATRNAAVARSVALSR
jgi:hypothetical protein